MKSYYKQDGLLPVAPILILEISYTANSISAKDVSSLAVEVRA